MHTHTINYNIICVINSKGQNELQKESVSSEFEADMNDDTSIFIDLDMVSQSTLLERKRQEMIRVDQQLQKTKVETELMMIRVEKGEKEFRTKQELFKKQVSQFEKFIIDSDKKRNIKLKQIEEERMLIKEKIRMISKNNESLFALKVNSKKLKYELNSLIRYQNYLNSIIKDNDENTNNSNIELIDDKLFGTGGVAVVYHNNNNYTMVDELLQRYNILYVTHEQLKENVFHSQSEIEHFSHLFTTLIKTSKNSILVKNSKIANCLKVYEIACSNRQSIEHGLHKTYLENQECHRMCNQIKLAIVNIYERMYDSSYASNKRPAFVDTKNEKSKNCEKKHYCRLLNEIQQRFSDLIDIIKVK